MTSQAQKLLAEAMGLPEDDRRLLAEELLDSVESDSDGQLAAAWRVEVLNRVAEIERGDAVTESYAEVKKHLSEALGERDV